MILVGGYVGARGCTGSARTGARALMSWFLGVYRLSGGRNLGIYTCQVIAGSRTLSVHSEGRACDLGCPQGVSWAQPLADALVSESAELGVQLVIFDRRVWSSLHPYEGWRPYTGTNPHDTHLHVELTPESAATLTVGWVNTIMAALPVNGVSWTERIVDQLPILRQGATGVPVKRLQALLTAGGALADGGIDGVFGNRTAVALGAYQVAHHVPNSIRADGSGDRICGPASWAYLLTSG